MPKGRRAWARLTLGACAAVALSAAAVQTQTVVPPSIATDQVNYSAGQEVFISGLNWSAGELVTLNIAEDGNPGHVDTLYATADASGGLTAEYIVPGHGTVQNFTMTATSPSAGTPVTTGFTDTGNPGAFSWDTSGWTTALPTSSPWVRTDRIDYQPGEVALIAGGGWAAGDFVTLSFTETGGTVFHPTVRLHAVADQSGAVYGGFVLQRHDLGESYALVATSVANPSMTAQTTLTDGGVGRHTCAVTTSGGVKCWGDNPNGQLGDGSTTQRTTPVDVTGLTSGITQISLGIEHTCVLTASGGVKCWGLNSFGQLGDGTVTTRTTPVDVSGLTSGVAQISAGGYHTCAVTTSGGVKCWGLNGYSQLGDGTSNYPATIPRDVISLTTGVVQISAGGYHTCALTTGGGVKCWGLNFYGEVGDGSTTFTFSTPVDVSGLTSGVVQISTGEIHTCALTTSGGAKCWGYNNTGALGDGTTPNRLTPVDVSGLTSGVVQISAGGYHTCALTPSGGVKCWGRNDFGQVGDGTTTQRTTPVNVSGLTNGVAQISPEDLHSCALTTSGGVKCWGKNDLGQLGDGSTTNRSTPGDVSGLTSGVIAIPEVKVNAYTLAYTAGAHGTISGTALQTVYQGRNGTAVTAVADASYHFVSWSDGVLSATRTDTNVTANLSVTASFVINTYTLTYTAGVHGTISGSSSQTVAQGTDGTAITAVPDAGYHFVTWSDSSTQNPRTDTNVMGNITVAASFAINISPCDPSLALAVGTISTFAGSGPAGFNGGGFGGDGGLATDALLKFPFGVAIGNGALFIADANNHRIRRVNLTTCVIDTVAGTGTAGFSGDGGLAVNAKLNSPHGVAVDNGLLYIGDTNNHRVRRVDLSTGLIATVAGNGNLTFAGDGGAATAASLSVPFGVSVSSGTLYIADRGHNRIRAVTLATAIITTAAGNGSGTFAGDGGPATAASLNLPQDMAVGNGSLFIADRQNARVRRVDLTTGIITTIAGGNAGGFSGDEGPATSAQLQNPGGVAIGPSVMFIGDTFNERVRRVQRLYGQQTLVVTGAPGSAPFNTSFTVGTSGGSGNGAVTFSATGACANTGGGALITMTSGTGNCSIIATKASDGTYKSTTSSAAAVTATKADQATLTVTGAPSSAAYLSSFSLGTSGGSGSGAVTISAAGACTNSGGGALVTMTTGSGICSITATKAGDADYNQTSSAPVSVTATQAAQPTLTVTGAPASAAYASSFTVSTTGGGGTGLVSFSVTGVCSRSGAVVTMTSGTGSCSITATKAADANYLAATSAAVTVTAVKATQPPLVVTGAPAGATYGTTFTVGTTGGGGFGTVTYAASGACSNTNGGALITMTSGTGTCSVGASKAGDANYLPATSQAAYRVVSSFGGGTYLYAPLLQTATGDLVGTTFGGGASGFGTVFKFNPTTGTVSTVHEFTGNDGARPQVGLVQASDGTLLGTTPQGGADGWLSGQNALGTIYKMDTLGGFVTRYVFTPSSYHVTGAYPDTPLVRVSDTLFYGTTPQGGPLGGSLGFGTIFTFDPTTGNVSVVYAFDGVHGARPEAALVRASDGLLYGTTYEGGPSNAGTVFRLNVDNSLTTLYAFGGTDGSHPAAALVQATDGKLYGTTANGGPNDWGTVFKVDPASGQLTTVYAFVGVANPPVNNGSSPHALVQASDGYLYGTTASLGPWFNGTIFRVDPTTGSVATVYGFDRVGGTSPNGARPWAELIQAADGALYGTTLDGVSAGAGVIYQLRLSGAAVAATKAAQSILTVTGAPGSAAYGSSFTVATSGGGGSGGLTFSASGACSNSAGGALVTMTSGSGACSITVTKAADANYETATSAVVSVAATKATQAIVSVTGAPSSAVYATAFTVSATGGSGTGVPSFTASGACSNTAGGALITMTNGTGTCSITATRTGDANYLDASSAPALVSALQASQVPLTVSGAPASAAYATSFTVSATGGSSGGAVSFSVSGVCSLSGAVVTMTSGTGSCAITATKAADGNYLATTSGAVTVVATKAAQTPLIVTGAPSTAAFGTSFSLTTSGGSGTGAVTFAASGPCSNVAGGALITMTSGAGTCSITATKSGDTNYQPQTPFRVVWNFGGAGDGANPYAPLVQTPTGDLYGTTFAGGASGFGTIFRLNPMSGQQPSLVHQFTGNDGARPQVGVVQASDGTLFGTTPQGGADGWLSGQNALGTIYKVDAAGAFVTQFVFTPTGYHTTGAYPDTPLVRVSDTLFYGTTPQGGPNGGSLGYGTIFTFDPTTGSVNVAYAFDGVHGARPEAPLVRASDGLLYGTTYEGGPANAGTVFRLNADNTVTTLYTFGGGDGSHPAAAIVQASDGMLYGTTGTGGANDWGTVFRVDPTNGTFTSVYAFVGVANPPANNGAHPGGALVQASDGYLYGTTKDFGSSFNGTIFRFDPASGTLTTMYAFDRSGSTSPNGAQPVATLLQALDGALYGTAPNGGMLGAGVAFQFSPGAAISVAATKATQSTLTMTGAPASAAYASGFSVGTSGGSGTGAVTFSAAGACTNAGAVITMTSGSGSCSIAATKAADANYQAASASTSVTATKIVLMVAADSKEKVAGTPNPVLTYTAAGFVSGETAAVLSGAPILSTTATTGSPAGTYPILVSQGNLSSADYAFAFVNGTLLVTTPPFCDPSLALAPGTINSFAGSGPAGVLQGGFGGDGGVATNARLSQPFGVAVDSGALFIADGFNFRIRRVNLSTCVIDTVAGAQPFSPDYPGDVGDNRPATSALLNVPTGVAVSNGMLYIADKNNYRIRRVDLSTGIITTIAGTGSPGFSGDGGPAVNAQINTAFEVSIAGTNLFVADYGNHRVRRIDLVTGIIDTVAGNGVAASTGDGGPAANASLNLPVDMEVSNGALFIAETAAVRRVDLATGIITTVAGTGIVGYAGDGGSATAARIAPNGITVKNNTLFITARQSAIRRVDLTTGIITTIGGNGTAGFSGDGGPATGAMLDFPFDVAAVSGALFVSDLNNQRVRRIQLRATQAPLFVTAPASAVYGSVFAAQASGGSGTGAISFFTSGACTNSSGSANITMTSGTGTCSITAVKSADAGYEDAISAATLVAAAKAPQAPLTVSGAPPSAVNGTSFAVTAVGGSGTGALTFTASGACSNIEGNALITMTSGTGTCSITATKAGDDNFLATVSAPVSVGAITFILTSTVVACPTSVVYSGIAQTPCTVSVTAADGLALSPVATYANNVNVGTATAIYTFAGDANHAPSSDSKTFTIVQAATTTAIACPTSVQFTGSPLTPCTVSVTGAGLGSISAAADYTSNVNVGTATASYAYPGDSNHTGSSNSTSFAIAITCVCDGASSIPARFGSDLIQPGRILWFNNSFRVKHIGSADANDDEDVDREDGDEDGNNENEVWEALTTGQKPVTFWFTEQKVSFMVNGVLQTYNVPNGRITFTNAAGATQATTTFNPSTNTWETIVPASGLTGRLFASGLAWMVPATISGGLNPVLWTARITSDTPGLKVRWSWGAAAYSTFGGPSDYNSLGVKATSGSQWMPYANSDRAGTPENFKQYVVAGARGHGHNPVGWRSRSATTTQCGLGTWTTYTQSRWGANPNKPNSAGAVLDANFPPGGVTIGSPSGGFYLTFTTAAAIRSFLPAGGKVGTLQSSATDPTNSKAGGFAGQVLALQLSVYFSNAGLYGAGLPVLRVVDGGLKDYSVQQVLDLGNRVVGGQTSALPQGVTLSMLNDIVTSINENFESGKVDRGYLLP